MVETKEIKAIGTFVNVKNHNLFFNSCSTCSGNCCDGRNKFSLSPLILKDFKEVYENFAIVFTWEYGDLRAFMILNDGKGYCKYIDEKTGGCTIYDKRSPACKLYPISPYFDNIMVDTACEAVNVEFGTQIYKDGKVSDKFYHKRLNNFTKKLKETTDFLKTINNKDDFELVTNISGVDLYKYNKENSDNKFIQMHLKSLKHL